MINPNMIEEWFWQPGRPNAIDAINPATGKGLYSGENLEDIRKRYPGAIITTLDAILDAERTAFVSEPVRIDRERWDEMLGVLPPLQWKNERAAETFKMSEMTSGMITTIFCRIGENYFELSDNVNTPHDKIASACARLIGS